MEKSKETKPFGEHTSIEEVTAFLDTPRIRATILAVRAKKAAVEARVYTDTEQMRAQRRVDNTSDDVEVAELDPHNFAKLYDPALPTLAIDTEGPLAGVELVAIAAQQRKQNGQPTCNVVFIASSTNCGLVATTPEEKGVVELTHGILMSAEGKAFLGAFPTAVPAAIIETTNKALLQQCAALNIATLTHPEVAAVYGNKAYVAELAERSGIRPIRRLTLSELWQDDNLAEYVIKPSNGSGGIGVHTFCGIDEKPEAEKYFHFLASNGYEPIIEERILAWPVSEKNDGWESPEVEIGGVTLNALGLLEDCDAEPEQMDWNVRVIVADGEVVDLYVRMGTYGRPVNRHQGAEALTLEKFAACAGDDATELIGLLNEAAKRVATVIPSGVAGLDLTVDEQKIVRMFEANVGGAVGGLQTIACAYDDPERKLLGAHKLLDILLRRMHAPELHNSAGNVPMARDMSQIYTGLIATNNLEVFGALQETTVLKAASRLTAESWLLYNCASASGAEKERLLTIFRNVAPLEMNDCLVQLAQAPHAMHLLPHIEFFETIFGGKVEHKLAALGALIDASTPEKAIAVDRRLPTRRYEAFDIFVNKLLDKTIDRVGKNATKEELQVLRKAHAGIIAGFFELAIAEVQEISTSTPHTNVRIAAAALGFELALATQNNEQAEAFLHLLQAQGMSELAETILQERAVAAGFKLWLPAKEPPRHTDDSKKLPDTEPERILPLRPIPLATDHGLAQRL